MLNWYEEYDFHFINDKKNLNLETISFSPIVNIQNYNHKNFYILTKTLLSLKSKISGITP
ncbi:hypothetical protein [Candidatus Tisiphia endosymbiont of Ceraclea dissimilis]|uniref:hypothetical protein n=1 Tax=Candidatus Tisiphia endosymbiont of Ceraclea dissimilis TaxID=3077928 RepID=UPI003CCB2210